MQALLPEGPETQEEGGEREGGVSLRDENRKTRLQTRLQSSRKKCPNHSSARNGNPSRLFIQFVSSHVLTAWSMKCTE